MTPSLKKSSESDCVLNSEKKGIQRKIWNLRISGLHATSVFLYNNNNNNYYYYYMQRHSLQLVDN